MDYAKESLKKHEEWKGKIEVVATVPVKTKEDLSLAYTPGVAAPCIAIQKDVDRSYELTRRWNLCLVVTDGTAVLEDDLELSAGTLRRYGTRLYVAGDVTVPEEAEELLGRMEYLHVAGDVLLPAALEEAFYGIPDLEYGSLRVLLGHAIVGSPRLKLGKAMLDLYPQGVTCVDCAMVELEETLEPDVIAKKLRFDSCALVRCTEAQENAVLAVSKDVAKVQVRDLRPEDEQETVRMNGVCLCL